MSTRAMESHRYEAMRLTLVGSVAPALEACAQSMRASGLAVAVHHGQRERPGRIGRCFEAELVMEPYRGHGPARLTLSAIEGHDVMGVALCVGPGGGERRHDGVVSAADLTDEMVSGLVAALVDRVFATPRARAG
jgi:hypothetical protein